MCSVQMNSGIANILDSGSYKSHQDILEMKMQILIQEKYSIFLSELDSQYLPILNSRAVHLLKIRNIFSIIWACILGGGWWYFMSHICNIYDPSSYKKCFSLCWGNKFGNVNSAIPYFLSCKICYVIQNFVCKYVTVSKIYVSCPRIRY